MRVGIVTALREEASCITQAKLPFNQETQIAENTYIWFCGIGEEAARNAATQLQANGADALVSFGVAGALESGLQPGDLVLPESIILEDKAYPVASVWRNQLEQSLHSSQINVVNKAIASSSKTLTTEQEKRYFAEKTGACAVDMESGAIAEVAAKHGMPFIAVRAIIDPIDFSPPDALLSAIKPDGGVKILRLITLILNGSVSINALLQLAKGMRAARKTLIAIVEIASIQFNN